MKTRNRKQIRDRYLNYLDPNLNKNKFTKWEDEMIIEQFLLLGKKWSLIAKNFQGKTGDMVKNRFYSSLKKRISKLDILDPQKNLQQPKKIGSGSQKTNNSEGVPEQFNDDNIKMEDGILQLDKSKFSEELYRKVKNNAKRTIFDKNQNMIDEIKVESNDQVGMNNENFICKFLNSIINEPDMCKSTQAESKEGKIDCSYGKNPNPEFLEDNSFNNSSVKNDYSIVDEYFCYN